MKYSKGNKFKLKLPLPCKLKLPLPCLKKDLTEKVSVMLGINVITLTGLRNYFVKRQS